MCLWENRCVYAQRVEARLKLGCSLPHYHKQWYMRAGTHCNLTNKFTPECSPELMGGQVLLSEGEWMFLNMEKTHLSLFSWRGWRAAQPRWGRTKKQQESKERKNKGIGKLTSKQLALGFILSPTLAIVQNILTLPHCFMLGLCWGPRM